MQPCVSLALGLMERGQETTVLAHENFKDFVEGYGLRFYPLVGNVSRNSVVAKNATTAADGKIYLVEYFNLDVIISKGYRVKSRRGTQFRILAAKILKECMVKGYTIDKKHLQEQSRQLSELKQTVKLLVNLIDSKTLNSDETI